MRPRRIVIAATQVPFHTGGAEWHVRALHQQLIEHGFTTEVVQLPFQWNPWSEAIRSALAWRMLDLTHSGGLPIDLVIATRFPSYVLKHPRKVVWLFHQFRQAYDLHEAGVDGYPDSEDGRRMRSHLIDFDTHALRECRRLYTTSRNNAGRLERYNGLKAEVLRLPLLDPQSWRCEAWEDMVLSVGRLDTLKRTEMLVRAVPLLPSRVRVVIVGQGPLRERLVALAESLGAAERVRFAGHVDEATLKSLYSRCSAVFYAPFDEDYGLVTLEAFHSRKPVVTTPDSGGPLEFVRHGETGLVAQADPASVAASLAQLVEDKALARDLGQRGFESVEDIRWDRVVEALVGD